MTIKRRGKGEGSIVLREDGRWMARIDLGWENGKRRTKAIYGNTRRAVANALPSALRAAQEGSLVRDERQTTAQFLTRWLNDVARPRVRPRTFAGYQAVTERHIIPHIGRLCLSKLTPLHLQAWLATLESSGVPAGRRLYARTVLRTALNTAMRWRLVTSNAATLVDVPRVTSREIRPLSPEGAQALLEATRHHPLDAFLTVALGCGLRLGESLGLQWSDIDLEAATLQVQRAVQRFGGDPATRRKLIQERRRLSKVLTVARAE